MTQVDGIGGVFFRARDPEGLTRWYREVFGIEGGADFWRQQGGPTVFSAFREDTEYFDRPSQQWMINFRVSNLDALVEQLRAEGIEVIQKDEWNSEVGEFARVHDPEGNPIELWQPSETCR